MTMTTTTTAYSILGTHSNSVNSVVVSLSFFCMVHNVLNYHRLFAGFLMVLFFEQSFVSVVVDDFYDLIRFQKFLRVVQMYRKFVSMQFSFFVFPFIFFAAATTAAAAATTTAAAAAAAVVVDVHSHWLFDCRLHV